MHIYIDTHILNMQTDGSCGILSQLSWKERMNARRIAGKPRVSIQLFIYTHIIVYTIIYTYTIYSDMHTI